MNQRPTQPFTRSGSPKMSSYDRRRRRKRLIEQSLKRNGHIACYWCAKRLTRRAVTLDHYIPRAQGGRDALDNLRLACWSCNREKSDLHPFEYVR